MDSSHRPDTSSWVLSGGVNLLLCSNSTGCDRDGFLAQLVVQKCTTYPRLHNKLSSKSATNRTSGVWALVHIECTRCIDASYCFRSLYVAWSVSVCVFVDHDLTCPEKTTEPMEMPFGEGGVHSYGPKEHGYMGYLLAPPGDTIKRDVLGGDAGCRYHYCSNLLLLRWPLSQWCA